MKKNLSGSLPTTPATARVENTEGLFIESPIEEIVLYDECGDTQWDKVLEQHDLADQLSKNSGKK